MRVALRAIHSLGGEHVRVFGCIGFFFLFFCLSALPLHAHEVLQASGGASDTFAVVGDTLDLDTNAQAREAPRVYIDCGRCDYDHIRREITFVRYVRDPEQADVHVFVTNESTGGGGQEYEFSFLGQRAFAETDHTLTLTVGRDATWDETREEVNRVLEVGFVPYVMQTPLSEQLSVEYEELEEDQEGAQLAEDPWNYWVFEIYGGRVQMSHESNQSNFNSRWGFYADRVTEAWKTRLRPYFNYSFVHIEEEDGESVTSHNHRHGFDSYAIRSITDHWSLGLFGDYITRNDRNLNHRVRVNPGVEYSVFPYEEATRRSITFTYQLGITEVDYYEETIFFQTAEQLINHQLSASVSYEQPWGDVNIGLTGSHYFHDIEHYRAQFYANASVRVTEGLSLNFWGNFEMIQDQLSLPRGDTTVEDVLLDQRELATDFSVSGSISLSYTFGSDFADVVNTRF